MIEPTWFIRVERRVQRWLDRGTGRIWVVAVSGGSDSVGLLRVLQTMAPRVGLSLTAAHLDHGTRGEAGRADAAFVAEHVQALDIPLDLGQWAPVRSGHFEDDARHARLAFLYNVARARGASAVALGHTGDDQAETILHRVTRGTGLRGLAGIPARRVLGEGVSLLRPLLDVSRQEIRAFLAELGQPYREDATNTDPRQTRARIRHELLPWLAADFNPQVTGALGRLARLAGASYRELHRRARQLERAAAVSANDAVVFDRQRLRSESMVIRGEAIRLAWRRAGWPEKDMDAARWQRIAALAARGRPGPVDVGGGIVAESDGTRFILRCRPSSVSMPALPADVPLAIPGAAAWPGGRVVATLDSAEPCDETIDLSRLTPPVCLRAPRPGDRFDPLGMGGHAQALNDFFRGRHISPEVRARTPLVCDASGIVWVVGHRIADRVGLTETTVRTAGLRWEAS